MSKHLGPQKWFFSISIQPKLRQLFQFSFLKHDVDSKVVENTLQNAPSRLKHSQYNRQAAEEESYPGEIELQNERRNEN